MNSDSTAYTHVKVIGLDPEQALMMPLKKQLDLTWYVDANTSPLTAILRSTDPDQDMSAHRSSCVLEHLHGFISFKNKD